MCDSKFRDNNRSLWFKNQTNFFPFCNQQSRETKCSSRLPTNFAEQIVKHNENHNARNYESAFAAPKRLMCTSDGVEVAARHVNFSQTSTVEALCKKESACINLISGEH